jgi:Fe-S-cluster containining protein
MDQPFINTSESVSRPLLAIPAEAVRMHTEIVTGLHEVEKAAFESCLEPEFIRRYFEVLDLFEKYQKVVVNASEYTVSCRRGCSHCCYHWVEDVNSFEAQIIAQYVTKHLSHKIETIVEQCREDEKLLTHIENLTLEKIAHGNQAAGLDHIDLVLSVFYQMKKSCPLLLESGVCSIYRVRPLTCRIYMSFSDTVLCDPQYQDQDDTPNYLLNLEEEASDILDRLHFKYQKFQGDSGLRSQLLKHLTCSADL